MKKIALYTSLLPALLCACSRPVETTSVQQRYTYYGEVLTVEEIHAIEAETELHGISYKQPVDGISGSYWNTSEEAQAAIHAYMSEYGLIYSETGIGSASPSND